MKVIKMILVITLLLFASTAQAQLTDEEQACVNAGTCVISLPPATGECEAVPFYGFSPGGEVAGASFCPIKIVKYNSVQDTTPYCPDGVDICDVVPFMCKIIVDIGESSYGIQWRTYFSNNDMMCDVIIENLMELKPIEFEDVELGSLTSMAGGSFVGTHAWRIMTLDIK